jgi:carbamate kinase
VTRVVVAVGGNAIEADGSFDARRRTATETAASVAAAAHGTDLVVTHGNGPQVGNRLLEVEASDVPDRPLDALVAETQAAIGSLLRRGLEPVLDRPVGGLLTRVVVDADDAAFDDPDKPVGPWYSEAEAADLAFETARVGEGDRPYRRVVPSPTPESVPDAAAVRALLDAGQAVVCGGGGGVPVVERSGGLEGVAAVVDKDLTSAALADAVDADRLVFLTDVDGAYLDYGTAEERRLEAVDPVTVRSSLADGEFGAGSMAPKMRAAARVAGSGGTAVVAHVEDPAGALAGEAGTVVQPSNSTDS